MGSVTVTDISQSFTRKMAAKINWHRYGTKLRHCRPVYYYTRLAFRGLSVCLSVCLSVDTALFYHKMVAKTE